MKRNKLIKFYQINVAIKSSSQQKNLWLSPHRLNAYKKNEKSVFYIQKNFLRIKNKNNS